MRPSENQNAKLIGDAFVPSFESPMFLIHIVYYSFN